MLQGISQNAELMALCARRNVDAPAGNRITEILNASPDWHGFLKITELNRVVPLVYETLNSGNIEGVPDFVMSSLSSAYKTNTGRNIFLAGELVGILDLLEKKGIETIPFKGPVLAEMLYGNIDGRQFYDLDFLIKEKDVFTARDALLDEGFHPQIEYRGMRERAYLKSYGEYGFARDPGRVTMELHWEITPHHFAFDMDMDRIWSNAESMEFRDRRIPAIPEDELFIALCIHASRHFWNRLIWICDIDRMIAGRKSLNWPRILKIAERRGGKRMILLGLYLADRLLGCPVPDETAGPLAEDKSLPGLAAEAADRFLINEEESDLANHFALVKQRERFRDRFAYFFRLFSTPNAQDIDFLPLPSFLSKLYILVRPVRLIKDYGIAPVYSFFKSLFKP